MSDTGIGVVRNVECHMLWGTGAQHAAVLERDRCFPVPAVNER
ncbi:glycerol-3-phosphate dehydrogenase [Zymobacter palmae]|uniref:Glycerol-3-phosphate dehydrogenase n=1 Tax=Zymobacter palmae TaxID=33074 RepID=A0A348HEA7_9GAMM|nr:glycerol-3-phosphate dehydrogenase [Zymobacter palmae]